MKDKFNPLKQILSLQKFKLNPDQVAQVYPRAYALPQFFTNNLLSESRVVKYFQGPYALMGSFYYQLMKLSLQIESEGINYRDIIFNKFVRFDLFGEGELEDEVFTDFQYRKFMKDFIQLVQSQDIPSFEKNVEKYPVIDQILIKLFKIILPLPLLVELQEQNQMQIETAKKILGFLCEQFSITITQIGRHCFKFEESDTFLYFENIRQVFLAFNQGYIDDKSQNSEFKSCFQCGEGNSFVTKYHTQSKQESLIQRLKQSQQSQRIWIQTNDLPLKNQHYTNKENNRDNEKVKDKEDEKTDCNSSRLTYQPYVQAQPHKSLSLFLNKDSISAQPKMLGLYEQFTNSLILKQMPVAVRQKIRLIKDKYIGRQKRSSIRSYI